MATLVLAPVHFAWKRRTRPPNAVVVGTAEVIAASALDAAYVYSAIIDSVIRPQRQICTASQREARPLSHTQK